MRNKIFDHLLQIANVCFIFGIALTIILVHQSSNDEIVINWAKLYIPCIIFLIISLVIATVFAIYKKNYFVLIGMHISKRSITLYKWSVYMLFLNIFIAMLMLFLGLLLLNDKQGEVFFKNGYLWIIFGLETFLTLVDVGIDAVCKLQVKLDLARKRGGSDFLLSKDYNNEKFDSKADAESKN